jgi:cyanophycin synthetase
LILEGIASADKETTYEVVTLETEAIRHAISLAQDGTFIVALSDVIDNAIDIVQSYLDSEIEQGVIS